MLYEFPIEEDTDNIEFAIQIKESLYKIRVPVIVFRYGFSPTSMTIKKHDYIWYADLGESLYVYLPDAKNMFAYWGRDTGNRYYAEELNGNMFRIDISELKRIIKQKDKIRLKT